MNIYRKGLIVLTCFLLSTHFVMAQEAMVKGKVLAEGKAVEFAVVSSNGMQAITDSVGFYELSNLKAGIYKLQVSFVGYKKMVKTITVKPIDTLKLDFDITNFENTINEVVITGTLKEVRRLDSPVPVEVYTPAFFKKNPTACIFDALQNINGVRPQLNCNICNTGDIHINGLEGPYTMVLIDGMPIVSSLSTVYGLSGIPNSLIERVEVVKGPASSLYGSEAVGGLINIITKNAEKAPLFSVDLFSTTWQEYNLDLGFKLKVTEKAKVLTGINYFNFQNRVDHNRDNFTDMTLQNRISIFQKWNFNRAKSRVFTLAGRYMNEDRWGGDMRWNKSYRGGSEIYGESIYTNRWELLGNYQLPVKEKMMFAFSLNQHDQDSRYGNVSYIAQQNIAFGQLTWDKTTGNHDLLIGSALRYTFYDDNTSTTSNFNNENKAQKSWLPGVFVQDEISLAEKQTLLLGFRYDYNSLHGNIFTPRFAYKYTINDKNILRFNAGTGFRIVNLFTEDHAALTGAREVEIKNKLNPEQSYNANLNYIKKFYTPNGTLISFDGSAFFTYFNNRIVGDFDTDPNKIIYDNLSGHAISKGLTLNMDISFNSGLKAIIGGTLMENTLTENGETRQQILTEKFTGTWAISYKFRKSNLAIDYTGNLYSPMRLPLLSETDPRKPYSPWWSIQNIQLLYTGFKNIELYGGVKNLLNWTPNKGNPFIIARANDPFDKEVDFDSNGKVLVTPNNPYGLTFDPNYVYGPNQGIRGFVGVRMNLN